MNEAVGTSTQFLNHLASISASTRQVHVSRLVMRSSNNIEVMCMHSYTLAGQATAYIIFIIVTAVKTSGLHIQTRAPERQT